MLDLHSGIPLIADLSALEGDAFYRQITGYSAEFLSTHAPALKGYGKLWGQDPFKLWSRRYEYPYAAQKTIQFGRHESKRPLKFLDAGSGVTFFPHFVSSVIGDTSFVCVDSNKSYHEMFADIAAATKDNPVTFVEAMLQKLPMQTGELDGVICISVLEHTDNYGEIVKEFARVTRPGGLLVLTFDLSLDGKFPLKKETAADLLGHVSEAYEAPAGVDWSASLDRMDDKAGLLSTDYVKNASPEFLPWRYPMLKAAKDLIGGHGWTGGFRSKAVFCLEARRKGN